MRTVKSPGFSNTGSLYASSLKGQCHEIFCFRFFSWIIFPQVPEKNIRVISIFFLNSRRYLQVKVHHRLQWLRRLICHRYRWCCWYQWQICYCCQRNRHIMGTISDCWHLKVKLKKKIYLYVSQLPKGVPKKVTKTFLMDDFFQLPPVSTTRVVHLELWISPRIFEKIRNGPNGILRGLGETDSWKKPEVSWLCP